MWPGGGLGVAHGLVGPARAEKAEEVLGPLVRITVLLVGLLHVLDVPGVTRVGARSGAGGGGVSK